MSLGPSAPTNFEVLVQQTVTGQGTSTSRPCMRPLTRLPDVSRPGEPKVLVLGVRASEGLVTLCGSYAFYAWWAYFPPAIGGPR